MTQVGMKAALGISRSRSQVSWSSSFFASFRSAVSNPSVNQPYAGARTSRAFGSPPPFAPQPGKAHRGAQLVRLRLLRSRDAQRFLEGVFRVFESVETAERDASEAVKIRLPLAAARFFPRLQSLPGRGESRLVLALPRQGLRQAGKAVRAIPQRAEPA